MFPLPRPTFFRVSKVGEKLRASKKRRKTTFLYSKRRTPGVVSDAVTKRDELGETDERDSFRVSSRRFCCRVKEGLNESAATTKPSSSSTDRCGFGCWKRVQSLGRCQEQQEKNRSEEDHDHRCGTDCHWTGNYALSSLRLRLLHRPTAREKQR